MISQLNWICWWKYPTLKNARAKELIIIFIVIETMRHSFMLRQWMNRRQDHRKTIRSPHRFQIEKTKSWTCQSAITWSKPFNYIFPVPQFFSPSSSSSLYFALLFIHNTVVVISSKSMWFNDIRETIEHFSVSNPFSKSDDGNNDDDGLTEMVFFFVRLVKYMWLSHSLSLILFHTSIVTND